MEVFEGVDAFDPEDSPSVLSIGNFDGVHLAPQGDLPIHQSGGLTARRPERHIYVRAAPLVRGRPERRPPLMTTLEEKLSRLEDQNVGAVVVEKFTPDLAQTERGISFGG